MTKEQKKNYEKYTYYKCYKIKFCPVTFGDDKMTGKIHLFYAATTGGMLMPVLATGGLNTEQKIIAVITCGLGGLIPDIDCPNSMLGRMIYPIAYLIKKMFGHRTILHDPLFYIVLHFIIRELTGVDYLQSSLLYQSIALGIGTHLFLDLMTQKGIQICFFFRLRLLKFKAETLATTIFIALLCVLNFGIAVLLKKYM